MVIYANYYDLNKLKQEAATAITPGVDESHRPAGCYCKPGNEVEIKLQRKKVEKERKTV